MFYFLPAFGLKYNVSEKGEDSLTTKLFSEDILFKILTWVMHKFPIKYVTI